MNPSSPHTPLFQPDENNYHQYTHMSSDTVLLVMEVTELHCWLQMILSQKVTTT
jgi:hypothetical protein